MRVPLNWLKEYLDFSASPEEIGKMLTNLGLEVEEIEDRQALYAGLVVAKIEGIRKHPNADSLTLVTIDNGTEKLEVVCGAPNVTLGAKVVYAPMGTTLPTGLFIDEATIRGVVSRGMLCSRDELGWQKEREGGIIILEADAPLGMSLSAYLEMEDKVLVLGLTPNLGHATGMIGVARELAALRGGQVKYPLIEPHSEAKKVEDFMTIQIEETDLCPRYSVRIIGGVKVGPSPNWLQQKLLAAGLRPINNIVDITNYVMWEYGQPLHAFDLDKIKGHKIIIRSAQVGEKLVTLDGKNRDLGEDNLVIADEAGPICLAGVMGGEGTEVTSESKNILLEVASFKGESVRHTVKKFALASESSYRFERGTDIERVKEVSLRAARLIEELAGGEMIGCFVDAYPQTFVPKIIDLRYSRVNALLGTFIPVLEIKGILENLGFIVEESKEDKDTIKVQIPSFRNDLEIEADLIEEVARLYGYNKIPVDFPQVKLERGEKSLEQVLSEEISRILQGFGFSQVLTLPLVPKEEKDFPDAQVDYCLANPLNEEQGGLRKKIVPGLLKALEFNVKRQVPKVKIYELGKVFYQHKVDEKPAEETSLGLLLMGAEGKEPWTKEAPAFFALKGVLENIFQALNLECTWQKGQRQYLHPGRQGEIFLGDESIGYLGELHPALGEKYGLPKRVALSELNFAKLEAGQLARVDYQGVPRYPAINRDLAFLLDEDVSARELAKLIREKAGPDLEELNLFDYYKGEQVPEGKKSLAYSMTFRNKERTLTDKEIEIQMEKIIKEITSRLQAQLRS